MSSGLWNDIKANPMAVVFSLLVHAVIVVILSANLSSSEVHRPQANKQKTIKAVIIDANKVDAELKKIKQAEKNEKQRKLNQRKKQEKEAARLKRKLQKEKKRLAEIKRKKNHELKRLAELKEQKAKEEKKQKQEEKKRKLEREKKRKKKEAAEKRRKEEALELQKRLAEEEKKEQETRRNKEREGRLNVLRSQYVKLIEQKVERNWVRPATVAAGKSCEVYVTQSIIGDVISVNIQKCANDPVFRRSIERAVRKASPLPPAPEPGVFDKEIHFIFKSK